MECICSKKFEILQLKEKKKGGGGMKQYLSSHSAAIL